MVDGWRYYNHALLPTCAPHEITDVSRLNEKVFWSQTPGNAILARWTSDFDLKEEGNWWYVIKDDEFDISKLKSKRRYEINKGKKNFEVKEIDPLLFIDEIVDIHIKAYEEYPIQYRPVVNNDKLSQEIIEWKNNAKIFGAFSLEDSKLYGFAMAVEYDTYVNFTMLKVVPSSERKGINAALVAGLLEHYNDRLTNGYYICDGERALFHETQFQDYLEKYFGFRKAYSNLHIKFRFPFSIIIKCLFPIRGLVEKSGLGIMKKINVLLLYYELSR